MHVLTVEKPLREILGEDGVDALIRLINQAGEEQKNGILKFVEEKFERRLSEEISGLKVDLIQIITEGENALGEKITEGDMRLVEKISEGDKALAEKITEGDMRLVEKISETDARLSTLIYETKSELLNHASETKSDLMTHVSETKTELTTLISATRADNAAIKAELIKWMFIFWIGQVAVILGMLFTFFKK